MFICFCVVPSVVDVMVNNSVYEPPCLSVSVSFCCGGCVVNNSVYEPPCLSVSV